MKASEVVAELTRLISQHGDLDTLYECENGLLEIDRLEMNEVVFLKAQGQPGAAPKPVIVIS